MVELVTEIIVAILALFGTLAGAYFANQRGTALVVYRIDQLENKVEKHNQVIERVYKIEQHEAVLDEEIKVANHRIEDLEGFHK